MRIVQHVVWLKRIHNVVEKIFDSNNLITDNFDVVENKRNHQFWKAMRYDVRYNKF